MTELDDLIKEEDFLISTIITYANRLEHVRERIKSVSCTRARDPPAPRTQVAFDDRKLSIAWEHGAVTFRQSGEKAYQLIKLIYNAGEEGLEQSEIANQIHKDELASIRKQLESARNACEKARFPYEIVNENGKITLKPIV